MHLYCGIFYIQRYIRKVCLFMYIHSVKIVLNR
jgi:hypothetical protein